MEEHVVKKRKADKTDKTEIPSSEHDDRIVLNVGGQRFETTRTTLMAFPGSMLSQRFSMENSSINQPGKYHEFFFDRSPDAFKAILECYRNARAPIPQVTPHGVSASDWISDLLFWGLASEEKPVPIIPIASLDVAAQRRVRFCQLVYEEMKVLVDETNGNQLSATLWVEVNEKQVLLAIPVDPVTPKKMKLSDVLLYENTDYWFRAFVKCQVKTIEFTSSGSPSIQFRNVKKDPVPPYEDISEENQYEYDPSGSLRHFSEIWKLLGIKINVIHVGRRVIFPAKYGDRYPVSLWVDRKTPHLTRVDSRDITYHPIELSIDFNVPVS